jgi:hypothetical protein
MQEEKCGVILRFRVKPEWHGRIREEVPGLFERFVSAHAELMEGRDVLGPFLVEDDPTGGWLTITWQFPDREAASRLLQLWEDPPWSPYIEGTLEHGYKHEPEGGLPGFQTI